LEKKCWYIQMSYNLYDGNGTSLVNGSATQICNYLVCSSSCGSDDNSWLLLAAGIAAFFLFSRPKRQR